MVDKFIEVPANLEDINILKRFLNELVDKLNSNALVSYPISYPTGYVGPIPYSYSTLVGGYTNTILEAAARADAISGDAKNYITNNLTTNVLQNTEDLATITEQFGTFYNDATAAAWYGLTVKSGELISGFTVSGVDADTTTPGTAGSVFAVSADTFTVGRAIEDINDPAELAYVQANNLPYGTMYDANLGKVVPAFLVEWNGVGYDIFFNGKTEFSSYLSPGTTTIDGGNITTGSITSSQLTTGIALINGEVKSSDFTTIGGAGFRLKSNAAGTSADPTIYGAYIMGARLEGSFANVASFRVYSSTFPNNSGRVYYRDFKYNPTSSIGVALTSNTFYGEQYSTGYIKERICDSAQSIVEIEVGGSSDDGSTIYIQVSVDGGPFSTIFTGAPLSFYRSFIVQYDVPSPYHNTFVFRALPSSSKTAIRHLTCTVFNM